MEKTILITGVSGNLGQAIARRFAADNYFIAGSFVPNDRAVPGIPDAQLGKYTVDLLNEQDAGDFVANVIKERGTIDAAVLTVGGFAMGAVAATSSADILKQYRLNFETAYHVARPVFLQMLQQKQGRIFLVGARPGLSAAQSENMVAYGLSKSLLFRLADMLNLEAKGTQVVTSVIAPSTLDTPQNRASMPDADFSKWVSPDAIAEIIHFYCTEAGAAIREPLIKIYGDS